MAAYPPEVRFEDGSSLPFDSEEAYISFLKLTGRYVAPKTQAQLMAEKLAEFDTLAKPATDAVITVTSSPEVTVTEPLGVTPSVTTFFPQRKRSGPITIPLTPNEYSLFQLLKEYPEGIATPDVAALLDQPAGRIGGRLSKVHQTTRGIYFGPGRKWYLHHWARTAELTIMN